MTESETRTNKELLFTPASIGIASTTFYPSWYPGELRPNDSENLIVDKIRGDLAIRMLQTAASKGFQAFVVDGGSSEDFKVVVQSLALHIEDEQERGMSASRRQAFKGVSSLEGIKIICWTEPEKVSVPENCLPYALAPIISGKTDIVVPKRNSEARDTYPSYQIRDEDRGNQIVNALLRSRGLLTPEDPDLDLWFGPKFFRNIPGLLKLFFNVYKYKESKSEIDRLADPEKWANATFLPVIAALHSGYKVATVEVPYIHPPEQTLTELDSTIMKRKRAIQQRNIVLTTVQFMRYLDGNTKGKLVKTTS